MKYALPLALMIIAIIAAGCLSPPQSFGCCLRPNATIPNADGDVGCVLYNTTNDLEQPEYFSKSECDPTGLTGCNVTIDGNKQNLAICTDDQLVPCIEPDCQAMVCGDFAFKPRPAPGFTDLESAAGDAPPDLTAEGGAMQFYKSQCRFLPMDVKLKQIMKASKSQINVFRMGVGGSLDGYDQYRYFFPVSDKYCGLATSMIPGDKVDRYMNYLTADLETYNPVEDLTSNCLDDVDSPQGTDVPFGFTDYPGTMAFTAPDIGGGSYNAILPDKSNYKMTYRATVDYISGWDDGIVYDTPSVKVYKTIDTAFYKKQLSIAHAETIYDVHNTGKTRAPFECDMAGGECYSGTCNNQVYNRGVLLKDENNDGTYEEVVTDCNQVEDPIGLPAVVCAPTKTVTANGKDAPTMTYASVPVKSFRINLDKLHDSPFVKYKDAQKEDKDENGDGISDDNDLFKTWDNLQDIYSRGSTGVKRETVSWTNTGKTAGYAWEACQGSDCGNEWCSHVEEQTMGPPAGGIVFFGKTGDEFVKYDDDNDGDTSDAHEIIGYAIADEGEFKNTLFYKNCGLTSDDYIVVNLDQAKRTADPSGQECKTDSDCDNPGDLCGERIGVDLPGDCQNKVCVYTYTFSLDPERDEWKKLMKAFRPYFVRYVKSGLLKSNFEEDGCGDKVESMDVVLAGMPWVINFEKGIWWKSAQESNPVTYNLASTSAQVARDRNIYDEQMVDIPGTTSCDLRRSAGALDIPPLAGSFTDEYYEVLYSPYVILIKNPDDGKLGKCIVDNTGTGLPKVRTFGWCEPCTTSTLAYQNITAADRVYLPAYNMDVGSGVANDTQDICQVDYHLNWHGKFYTSDNVSCFNKYITDVSEYRDSVGSIGSPRTEPEATVVKERLGNYLKSGVLPVLDISDDSNWNLTNPLVSDEDNTVDYYQYDFERLFGNMGAVVAIVYHAGDTEASQDDLDTIVNRSTMVRQFCPRCLVAVHVDTPASNDTFQTAVHSIMSDPRALANVDMFTFSYAVSSKHSVYDGIDGLDNKSKAIAEDIASYGAASLALKEKGRPTMVVGFTVKDNDPPWNDEASYTQLFQGIVLDQQTLVKAGVIGLVYTPASTTVYDTDKLGLVDRKSSTIGLKTSKFCAFQKALQTMTTSPPIAMFNKVAAVETPINCTACSSLDAALNRCGPKATETEGYVDAMLCDDGTMCTLPDGMDKDVAKCPDNTVTENCKPCKDIPGYYTCTMTYGNGTQRPISEPMSVLNSDTYMDVIGGMSKPDKCCLLAGEGDLAMMYTYSKEVHQTPIASPIVFSESGDPNVDCGMGTDTGAVDEISQFCGVRQIPLRDYDINCSVTDTYMGLGG